jgi:septal ring factor EnvC (AmiA/AmiB activator)
VAKRRKDNEMNQVAADIWPVLLGSLLSVVVIYVGFINRMRIAIGILEEKVGKLEKNCDEVSDKLDELYNQLTVQEEKIKHVEQRQDAHSKKNDDVIKLITDFKIEMTKELSSVSKNMVKLSSDIDNFNRLVCVNDTGIKFKKGEE